MEYYFNMPWSYHQSKLIFGHEPRTREDNDMKRIHDDVDGVPKGDGAVLVDVADDEEIEMDDGTPQVRSMAIPRWLSTPEVTREYSCY
jgi:hypothetical protein